MNMKKTTRYIIITLVSVNLIIIACLFFLPNEEHHSADEDIHELKMAIFSFYLKNNRYPTCSEGLKVLEPYIEDNKIPLDPWGNSYVYLIPGPNQRDFGIISFGADGNPGGETDYYSWKNEIPGKYE